MSVFTRSCFSLCRLRVVGVIVLCLLFSPAGAPLAVSGETGLIVEWATEPETPIAVGKTIFASVNVKYVPPVESDENVEVTMGALYYSCSWSLDPDGSFSPASDNELQKFHTGQE